MAFTGTEEEKLRFTYNYILQAYKLNGMVPSIRQLSKELHRSYSAVRKSLHVLEEQGKLIFYNSSEKENPMMKYDLHNSVKTSEVKKVAYDYKNCNRPSVLKVGDRFTAEDVFEEENHRRRIINYEVVSIYPYMVVAQDIATGMNRGFSFGELVRIGLEKQPIEYEALRRERDHEA